MGQEVLDTGEEKGDNAVIAKGGVGGTGAERMDLGNAGPLDTWHCFHLPTAHCS